MAKWSRKMAQKKITPNENEKRAVVSVTAGGRAKRSGSTGKVAEISQRNWRFSDLQAGIESRLVRDLESDHIIERSDVRMIIPDRTLDRRISAGQPLKPEEADGIARLVRIVTYARKVFGAVDLADEWLRSPNPELDNEVPIRMSAADLGAREVEAVLGRIEHGVFG